MTLAQYAIARAFAQLSAIAEQRPLTATETEQLEALTPVIERFEARDVEKADSIVALRSATAAAGNGGR